MAARQVFPVINFCLLVVLSVAVVAGGRIVQNQQDELDRHAAELRLHRQYGEKLISGLDALRIASPAPVQTTPTESPADAPTGADASDKR